MERPLFLPLFSLILGLSLAGMFRYFLPASLLLPLLATALLALFLKSRLPFHLALSLVMFLCGNLSLEPVFSPRHPLNHIARFESGEQLVVEGVIDARPEATERGGKVYLRAEKVFRDKSVAAVTGRLLLYTGEGRTTFLTGDRVRFSSRIRQPRNYGLPGEFDYAGYLACRKVYATAFVKGADDLILIRQGADYRVQRAVDSLAARIGEFIGATAPGTEGAILRALLIGDMGHVPKEVRDAYSRTGVNHILSISGFHVGIIALFLFQLMMLAARSSEFLLLHLNLRRFVLVLTLPLLVFYLFLTGAAPATARSVIMIGVYILALLLERETDQVNSLMLAALFILALSPPALFDISFQLSFLALWGIVVLTPLFMAPFSKMRDSIPRKLLLFLMASAAATAATAAPVAYHFNRVSATGLISNFFIVPLMGYGAVVLGFSALPFTGVAPVLARPLILAAAFLVRISNQIIAVLDKLPMLPFFTPSRFDLLLCYLLIASLTFVRSGRWRGACCVVLALLWGGSLAMPQGEEGGKLVITMLSVGQGESTLITFPDGRKMLVDGGGSYREGAPDVGERLLAPALRTMGVKKIDYMVLTHPDSDHIQGLKYVAASFSVGEFWESGLHSGSADYRALKGILAERGVTVRRISGMDGALQAGGARIEPLSPLAGSLSRSSEDEEGGTNDDSLVFRLVYGDFSILLTGDIGRDVEERLALHPERLKCTVLKVPHHGSRFSSSEPFLDAVAPEIALISAGYRNSFRHPAPETVESLRQRRIRVYRTDLDGTIRVVCGGKGENASVETFAGIFIDRNPRFLIVSIRFFLARTLRYQEELCPWRKYSLSKMTVSSGKSSPTSSTWRGTRWKRLRPAPRPWNGWRAAISRW